MKKNKNSTRKISLAAGGPLADFFSKLKGEEQDELDKILGKHGIHARLNAVGMLVLKCPSAESKKISDRLSRLNDKPNKGMSIQEIQRLIESPVLEEEIEEKKVDWRSFSLRHHSSQSSSTVKPKTENQSKLMEEIDKKKVIFALGSAGSGKTFLATAVALKYLEMGYIEKIIISRPAVTSEEFGFLPGDIDEKMGPFLFPILDILAQLVGNQRRDNYLERKTIEILPVAFGRGLTIGSSFRPTIGIIDEAQNLTYKQLKMMITRLGDHQNSKLIFCGDESQSDLKAGQANSLRSVSDILAPSPYVGSVTFNSDDVVRSEAVKEALRLFEKYEEGLVKQKGRNNGGN